MTHYCDLTEGRVIQLTVLLAGLNAALILLGVTTMAIDMWQVFLPLAPAPPLA